MEKQEDFIALDTSLSIWNRFFTIAPLIVVGTKEGDGYDLAPKHMATPIGSSNYFGFVCTPNHSTYHNIKKSGEFSVSFPMPNQVVLASLSASPRCGEDQSTKSIVKSLPTIKTTNIDSIFVKNSYLYLECKLFQIIDGFGEYSFITGTVEAAFVHKDYARTSEKDEQQQIYEHPLLAYVSQGRFANISETFNFPYPKDFKL
ncbi:flavin reductase (DIM6/NTAB) family NADH-FMN oxidoreductase RutF [Saonia flava]|uniref:Flavin reductase (DIM6/NTAB) family NADH-FMN oxidoreductase RutF n=1 Tax=Saonia flava TaxID=523696 RepID=A0A846QZ47_9FLAO|nr:flavin reductase [Saonia flava]NJB72200.1 flavin reductase (DIM6/NTAB) family NADH-FMN oxidoreductase RutF [Saonia flava]